MKLLFVLVLPVYFYIVQNTILNKHTHVHSNGLIVSHSHPFSDSESSQQHKHSKTEINLFASLSFDLYEVPDFVSLDDYFADVIEEYLITEDHYDKNCYFLNTIPRGPPSELLLS